MHFGHLTLFLQVDFNMVDVAVSVDISGQNLLTIHDLGAKKLVFYIEQVKPHKSVNKILPCFHLSSICFEWDALNYILLYADNCPGLDDNSDEET